MLVGRQLTFAAFAVLLSASAVYAGPRISIGDPGRGTPVGLTFHFVTNASGGGFFTFTNASDVNWFSVDFRVRERTGTTITCAPGPFFRTCSNSVLSSNPGTTLFDIGFENPTEGGIAVGSSFTVDLNDLINGKPNTNPNGRGQWERATPFDAIANQAETAVPEPGTLALLLGAFGLFLVGGGYRALRVRLPRRTC
jgi:hypothetical protein